MTDLNNWPSPERISGQKWTTFRRSWIFFQAPDQYFDGNNLYDVRRCSPSKYNEMLVDLRSMRIARPWYWRAFDRLWWGL